MDLNREYHPLFQQKPDSPDDYEPEEFAKIQVIRLAAFGPISREERGSMRCPRLYAPDELASFDRFHEEFGGGSYEVQALRADGRFYQRRTFVLPGNSRPLAPDLSKTGSAAVPEIGLGAAATPGLDPMIALLMQLSSKSEERTMAMMANMMNMQASMAAANAQSQAASLQAVMGVVAAVVAGAGNKESPAETMKGFAEIMRANQPATDPMAALRGTLEASKLIREEAEASRGPEGPPEESTGTILKAVGEVAMPIFMKMAEGAGNGAAAVAHAPLFPAVP